MALGLMASFSRAAYKRAWSQLEDFRIEHLEEGTMEDVQTEGHAMFIPRSKRDQNGRVV